MFRLLGVCSDYILNDIKRLGVCKIMSVIKHEKHNNVKDLNNWSHGFH